MIEDIAQHPSLASSSMCMGTHSSTCTQPSHKQRLWLHSSFLYALSSSLNLAFHLLSICVLQCSCPYLDLFPYCILSFGVLEFPDEVLQTQACVLAGYQCPFPLTCICFSLIRLASLYEHFQVPPTSSISGPILEPYLASHFSDSLLRDFAHPSALWFLVFHI